MAFRMDKGLVNEAHAYHHSEDPPDRNGLAAIFGEISSAQLLQRRHDAREILTTMGLTDEKTITEEQIQTAAAFARKLTEWPHLKAEWLDRIQNEMLTDRRMMQDARLGELQIHEHLLQAAKVNVSNMGTWHVLSGQWGQMSTSGLRRGINGVLEA